MKLIFDGHSGSRIFVQLMQMCEEGLVVQNNLNVFQRYLQKRHYEYSRKKSLRKVG